MAAKIAALASGSPELADYQSAGAGIGVPIGPTGGAPGIRHLSAPMFAEQ